MTNGGFFSHSTPKEGSEKLVLITNSFGLQLFVVLFAPTEASEEILPKSSGYTYEDGDKLLVEFTKNKYITYIVQYPSVHYNNPALQYVWGVGNLLPREKYFYDGTISLRGDRPHKTNLTPPFFI
jgi:hypothetical protein